MALIGAHVIVSGRVQGVFFRANTQEKAVQLGLTGWVRNLPDRRSVEALVEGEDERVKRMVEWLRAGDPPARVDDVEVEWEPYSGGFKSFEVKH